MFNSFADSTVAARARRYKSRCGTYGLYRIGDRDRIPTGRQNWNIRQIVADHCGPIEIDPDLTQDDPQIAQFVAAPLDYILNPKIRGPGRNGV